MSVNKKYLPSKNKCTVTFSLPKSAAPKAKEIRVVGEFNNWDWNKGVSLKPTKTEYKGTLDLPAGKKYQFRYLIDNTSWENDWNADGYVPSPFIGIENSLVVLPNGELATEVKKVAKTATKKVAKAVKKTATTVSKATKKVTKTATKKNLDFTVIEGIGPKISGILQSKGYKSFTELAAAKVADLKNILKDAGSRFSMHDPSTWAEQSALAAQQKWTELEALKDKLKNGKRV